MGPKFPEGIGEAGGLTLSPAERRGQRCPGGPPTAIRPSGAPRAGRGGPPGPGRPRAAPSDGGAGRRGGLSQPVAFPGPLPAAKAPGGSGAAAWGRPGPPRRPGAGPGGIGAGSGPVGRARRGPRRSFRPIRSSRAAGAVPVGRQGPPGGGGGRRAAPRGVSGARRGRGPDRGWIGGRGAGGRGASTPRACRGGARGGFPPLARGAGAGRGSGGRRGPENAVAGPVPIARGRPGPRPPVGGPFRASGRHEWGSLERGGAEKRWGRPVGGRRGPERRRSARLPSPSVSPLASVDHSLRPDYIVEHRRGTNRNPIFSVCVFSECRPPRRGGRQAFW